MELKKENTYVMTVNCIAISEMLSRTQENVY